MIGNILYGIEYDLPKRSLAEVFSKTVVTEGINKGLKQFKELNDKK